MARGKHGRRREGPTDDPEQPLKPLRVEGRCAHCPCGEGRIELPGPSKEDREKMRSGSRVYYTLYCDKCVRKVLIEDPWTPRDSGRS